MTEFHIIGTGNIYEFVIKDIDNPRTYGRFGACGDDRKSMQEFVDYVNQLIKENEQLKEHQRTLEAKIVRLKDRVKTFEKHYSLKDIERYKKMDNCNCIDSRRLDE